MQIPGTTSYKPLCPYKFDIDRYSLVSSQCCSDATTWVCSSGHTHTSQSINDTCQSSVSSVSTGYRAGRPHRFPYHQLNYKYEYSIANKHFSSIRIRKNSRLHMKAINIHYLLTRLYSMTGAMPCEKTYPSCRPSCRTLSAWHRIRLNEHSACH